MKKFSFSLESVLKLQYQLEEQQKISFREAMNKLREEEQLLIEMKMQQLRYEDDLKEAEMGILDIQKVKNIKSSIDVMKSRVRTQMLKVHVAEKNAEAERIKLQEAMVNRKTYEKMKEKAFDEYKFEFASEENKEIDELVSYRHSGSR